MDSLSVAAIGVGHWGPNVVRNLAHHPRISLACVCDTEAARLENVAQYAGGPVTTLTDAGTVFDDSAINAVAILTPAATHYELTRQALEAGKHVLCEKPLTLDEAQAESLCALAEQKHLKLMVGHTFLFNPAVLKLKTLLDEGQIGSPYYLTSVRTHLGLVRNDVGVLWDLAPHDVVIMNYLLDAQPVRVSATGANPLHTGHEDVAFVNLTYPGGVIGSIHVSWMDTHKERSVAVIGDRGRAVFDDLDNLEPVRLFQKGIAVQTGPTPDFGEYHLLLRDGDIISPKVRRGEPLAMMIDAFVRLVCDDEDNPSIGKSGVEVARALAAAQRSIEEKGAPQEISDAADGSSRP